MLLNDNLIIGRLTYLFYCYWDSYMTEKESQEAFRMLGMDEQVDNSDAEFYQEQLVTITAELTKQMGSQ